MDCTIAQKPRLHRICLRKSEGASVSASRTGEAPWRCEQLRRRPQASFLRPPPSPRGVSRPPRRRRRSPPGAASVAIVSAPFRVPLPVRFFLSFYRCPDSSINRYYLLTPFSWDLLQVRNCLWRNSTHPLIYWYAASLCHLAPLSAMYSSL